MAENNAFDLKIITPDEIFYEGEGTFLEFVTVEGEMGVYKNHIPLTTILDVCAMKIHNGTEIKKAAIHGGFVEILKDRITVLAEMAEWPDAIDVERAKEAKKRAEELLTKSGSNIDLVRAEAALKRSMARLEATK